MYSVVKYSCAVLILTVLGVISYPTCYNWCPATGGAGYGCCDYYHGQGQGYYPGYIGHPGYIGYPGYPQIQQPLYCPEINCSNPPTQEKNCTDDNDCLRKEKCCTNPCDEGKKYCMIGTRQAVQSMQYCPAIDNCKKWLEENENKITICNSNDDCKRSDSCCSNPCRNEKVCLKTKGYTNPVQCITTTGTGICK